MTFSPRLLYFPLIKIVHFCNCTKTNSLSSPLLFSKTATNQNWTLLRYHGATGNDSVLRSSTNSDVLYPHNLSIIISYLLWRRWLLRSTRVSFLILLYLLFFFWFCQFTDFAFISYSVTQTANASEIKKAYYKLSLKQ
jgi:hypothetical protein